MIRQLCSKTFLNRPTSGPTLNGPFRELEYHYNCIVWAIVWDRNIEIDIGKWTICEGGQLERFDCIYKIMPGKHYMNRIHLLNRKDKTQT